MAREFMPVLTQFKGKDRAILCQKSEKGSALLAISNISLLNEDLGDSADSFEPLDLEGLVEPMVLGLKDVIGDLTSSQLNGKEEIYEKITRSLDSLTLLDPINTSCFEFAESDELELLKMLQVNVLHGWILDKNIKSLDFVRGASRSKFLTKIAEVEQGNNDALKQEMNGFINAPITDYGIYCLHEAIDEGELAVLYDKTEYHVIHKHDGFLFILETNEGILNQLPDAMWKKLAIEEKSSFHVTCNFTPANGQPKEKQELADEWLIEMLTASTKKNKKKKKKPNAEDLERGSTEDKAPITADKDRHDMKSNAEDLERCSTEDKDPITADKDRHDMKSNAEDLERGSTEDKDPITADKDRHDMKAPTPPTPVDKAPTTVDKEEEDAVSCRHKKFLQFVKENDLSAIYRLYDGVLDCTTTLVGREMGLGYLNYILDKFEQGKCWPMDGWRPEDMEVKDNGRDFIISKEPDQDLTPDLGVANLLTFVDLVFPEYKKEGISPAYFDSFAKDILMFSTVKKDSASWNRFVRYMRSHFALKAPLVRSTLICEFCRVISLQVAINSSQIDRLKRIIPSHSIQGIKDWREEVKNVKPFLQVYRFRNTVFLCYGRDRWESSHWHLLKYSRNFVEHVQEYIKAMIPIHDIPLVELMLARRLEYQITQTIRTIVLEFRVDGLFCSAWDHFECSNCNKMPLQLTHNERP